MLQMLGPIIQSINKGGEMYRDLTELESCLIEKMLASNFKGKEILLEQIYKSKVFLLQGYEFISLKFKTKELKKYPFEVRVPVAMKIFQEDVAPIICLLHVINGYIDELEIFIADFSRIDLTDVKLDKVEYDIDKEVEIC